MPRPTRWRVSAMPTWPKPITTTWLRSGSGLGASSCSEAAGLAFDAVEQRRPSAAPRPRSPPSSQRDRDRQDRLHGFAGEQAAAHRERQQDEAELAALGEQRRRARRPAARRSRSALARPDSSRPSAATGPRRSRPPRRAWRSAKPHIDRHADGHEEEAEQQAAEAGRCRPRSDGGIRCRRPSGRRRRRRAPSTGRPARSRSWRRAPAAASSP